MKSTRAIFRIIMNAENIVIGAGAGLSAAAGLLYTDPAFFKEHFPGYAERYGLSYTYEAAFHEFPTLEEHYTCWARHIKNIRIDFPSGEVYRNLLNLIKEKNTFVITTNCDGQFDKAGFDRQRMFTPQGDYSFFQCSVPCSDELYSNGAWVRKMLDGLSDDDFAAKTEDIPRCPRCGELLVPNLRKDSSFVEKPWMEKHKDYVSFINGVKGEELLLLELGVGFNTPTIIRFPFEQLAADRPDTTLIRINPGQPRMAIPEAAENTIITEQGIGEILDSEALKYV